MAHDAGGVPIDTVAHIALQLGRLLLQNGSDTDNVGADIRRLVAAFGCEANLLVTYEALIVTIDSHGVFRTKIGHRVPGMNVGMGMLHALDRLLTRAESGLSLDQIQAELDRIEHAPPAYPHWLVIAGMALTAASLSRLFVGDWGAFLITADCRCRADLVPPETGCPATQPDTDHLRRRLARRHRWRLRRRPRPHRHQSRSVSSCPA